MYEERLSTAEARRYEMEDLIGSLREQLRSQAQSPSPTSAARQLSSATQIENEALREQVVHLQKKLTITEDMLEEVHATAERDEAMVRDKIRRFKDKEDLLKQQVAECELEIAKLVKSENGARIRTEEVGEALRESTVALENARAEIEGLRAEIVVRKYIIPEGMIIDASQDLEGVASLSSTDSVDRPSEPTPRSTHGHTHYIEEIARLKSQLAEATEALQGADNDGISASSSQLQKTIDELVIEKTNVRYACAPVPAQLKVFFQLENIQSDLHARFAQETNAAADLRERFERSQAELETLRKKAHRDAPVSDGGQQTGKLSPSSTRHDSIPSSVREEMAGLK